MKFLLRLLTGALAALMLLGLHPIPASAQGADTDPYLWLEEDEGVKPLEWARTQDSATMSEFQKDPNFIKYQDEALKLLNAKDRIPGGQLMGNYIYNFWQDQDHPRGILRRATIAEYKKPAPQWEVVLDIDKLNKDEGKSWVYQGADVLPPDYSRALVSLSLGGKDATWVREYDYNQKAFVKDGFTVPEAKNSVSWFDSNTVIIGTDFGPGSLTSSGYPRIIKLWKRGTPLASAQTLMEGENSDVDVNGGVDFRPEGNTFTLHRSTSFWEQSGWLVDQKLKLQPMPFPKDARVDVFFKGYAVALLYSDWLGIPEGSVVALKTADFGSADLKSKVEVLFEPDDKSTVQSIGATKDYLLLSILRNVRGRILYLSLNESAGASKWTTGELKLPDLGTVGLSAYNAFGNSLMASFQDFLTPTKLYYLTDPAAAPEEIKSLPARFDAAGLKISQFEAASKDGTMIPYFVVARADLAADGNNPTLLYGYGGFRVSMTPSYSSSIGNLWLKQGGVYVLANIRGGGEFGPRWHRAGLLKNRQKVFDDFIAVAEDLIKRKITSPKHLGIMGGSNGGLLVGVAFTQRPELFNAVVCQVPLLDMLRYSKLPPGASWIGEYGDPDSADMRAYISTYSPYQNIKAGVKYPKILFVTSTKDDRVHPAHARKAAAKLEALGDKVYYYEETEGGHGAAADNAHRAKEQALEFAYLHRMLFD